MKIGLQTWGSQGDVGPFIALAAELRAAGHEVVVAVTHVENKDYSGAGEAFGFEVRRVGFFDQVSIDTVADALYREKNMAKLLDVSFKHYWDGVVDEIYQASRRLCEECDAVVGHFFVHPLRTAADQLGRPYGSLLIMPWIPTRSFSPLGKPLPLKVLHAAIWRVVEFFMARTFLPRTNALRRSAGLAPFRRVVGGSFSSLLLNLIPASPLLCPRPPDWGPESHICGTFVLPEKAIFPDQPAPWELPGSLQEFLDAGPAPVYVTFGLHSVHKDGFQQTARLVAEATRLAGCRTVLQTRGNPYDDAPKLPGIYYLRHGVDNRMYGLCSAVVHTGSGSTAHHVCRAGRPSIPVEHMGDEPFWANLLHQAGLATPCLKRRKLTAPALARAIRSVLDSRPMQERARRFGEKICEENGARRAVELIEQRLLPRA